ncbi:MAG: hypothetical protein MUP62_02725, partial [Dehalococcoidia bacterium]|nr:hypothetical protein [Dehalococcoidia bacterium]
HPEKLNGRLVVLDDQDALRLGHRIRPRLSPTPYTYTISVCVGVGKWYSEHAVCKIVSRGGKSGAALLERPPLPYRTLAFWGELLEGSPSVRCGEHDEGNRRHAGGA